MFKGKTILLIDDDQDMLEIGRRMITRAGYNYISASGGKEGLEKILTEKPDLIILDLMMPEMNGDEVFKELVTNEKYAERKDTPVIMLTARTDEFSDQTRLFEMGLAAWLVKPFGHRELMNVVENVLQLYEVKKKNRELEQEVKRTEYKYRDLIENANDLIFTLDQKGEFMFINNRIADLTGYRKEEWLGRSFFDFVSQQDQGVAREVFRESLEGRAKTFEIRAPCKNGKTIYLSTSIAPLLYEGGMVGVMGIARDITQRMRLEQEIIELKNFNESIIQSMESGVITIDLDGKVTSFNKGAEEILEYRAEEVIGRRLDEIIPEEEITRLLPPNPDPITTNREMEISTRNGKKVYIGYTVTPRYDNLNRKAGTIIVFRDISEIKRMQAELIRMDRLASLGVLASGIAHEIRNPLAGIKTIAQTLEEEIPPEDHRREYIARIIRQVNRLDELLKTFFSYAKPKQPVRKYHQLVAIIREVTLLLRKRLRSRKIVLVEDYAPDLIPVFVDLNQIQQVFINLILNAIDAMPDGGRLTIQARVVRTTLRAIDRRKGGLRMPREPSTFVEVKISDTGMGIKPEHLESIFDPFFTTKPQGAGLGLSIVYRIMQEHGGEVRVESQWGKGATFTLLLPTQR